MEVSAEAVRHHVELSRKVLGVVAGIQLHYVSRVETGNLVVNWSFVFVVVRLSHPSNNTRAIATVEVAWELARIWIMTGLDGQVDGRRNIFLAVQCESLLFIFCELVTPRHAREGRVAADTNLARVRVCDESWLAENDPVD